MHTRVYMQAYTMFVVYSLVNAYINIQLWSNRHRYLNRFLGGCSMSIVALAMGQSDGLTITSWAIDLYADIDGVRPGK